MRNRGIGFLEGMVIFLGSILPWAVIFSLIQFHAPETFIGTEGLQQVRTYLYWEFFGTIGMGICAAGAVLLSGLVSKSHRISVLRCIGAVVFGILLMTVITEHTRFHTQTKKNAYFGFTLMKTAALLTDIEKDLQEQKTIMLPESEYQLTVYQYIYQKTRGDSYRVSEYALNQEDTPIAQVSLKDYARFRDSIFFSGTHDIWLYEHSGLIAQIDDREITDFVSAESTYHIIYDEEAGFIRKEVFDFENSLDTLQLVFELDGEIMERRNVAGESEMVFRPLIPGTFTAYLEMRWNNSIRQVSNTLTYVSEEFPVTENPPHKAESITKNGVTHYFDETYQFSLDIPADIEMQIFDSDFTPARGYDDDRNLARSQDNPELFVDIIVTKSMIRYSAQEYLDQLKLSLNGKPAVLEEDTAPNEISGCYVYRDYGTAKGITCIYAVPGTEQRVRTYIRLEYLFSDENGYQKAVDSMKSFALS